MEVTIKTINIDKSLNLEFTMEVSKNMNICIYTSAYHDNGYCKSRGLLDYGSFNLFLDVKMEGSRLTTNKALKIAPKVLTIDFIKNEIKNCIEFYKTKGVNYIDNSKL